jgi:putative sugar O-methyltransferase
MRKEHQIPNVQRQIVEDPALLEALLTDAERADGIYAPGPYWAAKSKTAAAQIRASGIADFRGASSAVGVSYTDSVPVDRRLELPSDIKGLTLSRVLGRGSRASRGMRNHVALMFDNQVSLTQSMWEQWLEYKRQYLTDDERVRGLLAEYTLGDTLRGGCLDFVVIDGEPISCHYLELLLTHHHLAEQIEFGRYRTMFEIGGGFGANVHILISNYPNLRKFVYLDIAPNLYVGTQYLKSLYGSSVKTYSDLRDEKSIVFSTSDDLEVLCIAPHQIERLDVAVDIFENCHSFVEMPAAVVANYASHVTRLANPAGSALGLVSYDGSDPNTTWDPEQLPSFFDRAFTRSTHPKLALRRFDYHYVSVT